jgi:hypothetical protein
MAPFFGFVPAPRYATQTRAEALSAEIARESMQRGGLSKDQAEHSKAVGELIRQIRTGKVNNDGQLEAAARKAGVRSAAEVTRIKERVLWSPMQYQVSRMELGDAMRVFDLGNDKEKVSIAPFLAEKIQRAYDGERLGDEEAKRFVGLVMPYYRQAMMQGKGIPGR